MLGGTFSVSFYRTDVKTSSFRTIERIEPIKRIYGFLGESPVRMVSQEPRVMVFEKQITIIKIILSTNFDDLIIEISDIIILIIQISFRKNQSVVLLLPKVNL